MNDLAIALTSVRRYYKQKARYDTETKELFLVAHDGKETEIKASDVAYWSRRSAHAIFGDSNA